MIVSRDNRYLKDLRRLRRSRPEGRALLEGPHLVVEACRAGLEIDYALATPDFLGSETAADVLGALRHPPRAVDPRLLDELADADTPRGLVAVARIDLAGLDRLDPANGPLVWAEGVQDPGNLGAIARAAEAAGGSGLALAPGGVHPLHPRALRGSAGSLLRLPTARGVGLDELRRRFPPRRSRFAALSPRDGVDLYDADLAGALVLLVGAEGKGLSAAALDAADLLLTIPIAPAVESLNTAVAAAVTLFEIRRRRR